MLLLMIDLFQSSCWVIVVVVVDVVAAAVVPQ
jgi:hypothetical protein